MTRVTTANSPTTDRRPTAASFLLARMTFRTLRPSAEVPNRIQRAVQAVLAGDTRGARGEVERIDLPGLIHERAEAFEELRRRHLPKNRALDPEIEARRGPSEAEKLSLFEHDRFTCWFCQKRTVYAPVLAALSVPFADLIPYRTGWRPKAEHILFWTCTPSWDHLVPVARGGSSTDLENIVTSCYQCNDVRGDYLPDELGWSPVRPRASEWRGLSDQLDALRESLRIVAGPAAVLRGLIATEGLPDGALVRATILNKGKPYRDMFKVDSILGDQVVLKGMWRIGPERRWHIGHPRIVLVHEVTAVEILRDSAPEEGDRD